MIDYVGQVWYLFETFELIDGYWHQVKGHSNGVGSWPEGEKTHIFRAVGKNTDGTRVRLTRVYPKCSRDFDNLIRSKSKIYKDGEGNIFFE